MSSGSSYGELVIGKQDSSQALVASGSRRALRNASGVGLINMFVPDMRAWPSAKLQ